MVERQYRHAVRGLSSHLWRLGNWHPRASPQRRNSKTIAPSRDRGRSPDRRSRERLTYAQNVHFLITKTPAQSIEVIKSQRSILNARMLKEDWTQRNCTLWKT